MRQSPDETLRMCKMNLNICSFRMFEYNFSLDHFILQNIPVLTGRRAATALCQVIGARTLSEALSNRETITKALKVSLILSSLPPKVCVMLYLLPAKVGFLSALVA